MPDVTYYQYLDNIRDVLQAEFGGTEITVVLGLGNYSSYTDKILHVVPASPGIEYEFTGARTPTHRVFRPWYNCKIIGFNYITEASLEAGLYGITGKNGIIKMMEDVFNHLSGNFLSLSYIREVLVSFGDPAIYDVVIESGEENSFAAGGELVHKVRLKKFEAVAQQATPPTISNVDSGDPTQNSITIIFDTNKAGTSLIVYGTDPDNLDQESAHDETPVTSHSVELTGLTAGTTYYLKPRSRDNNDYWGTTAGKYTFTTQSAGGGGGNKVQPVV